MDSMTPTLRALDIGSSFEGAAGALSNFTARIFTMDSVPCASLEGLLQAAKFEDVLDQQAVCGLVGREAKRRGRARNAVWQASQTLWWQGVAMPRASLAYQRWLDRAFQAVHDIDPTFRAALADTGTALLTHGMGQADPTQTVLTESEFCERLMRLRAGERLWAEPA